MPAPVPIIGSALTAQLSESNGHVSAGIVIVPSRGVWKVCPLKLRDSRDAGSWAG